MWVEPTGTVTGGRLTITDDGSAVDADNSPGASDRLSTGDVAG